MCGLQQLERELQFLVRRGQVLEKFHVAIEVDQEDPVLAFAHHVIEKALARTALLSQHAPLAEARIHEQAQRQREIGLARTISDGLRPPVFF